MGENKTMPAIDFLTRPRLPCCEEAQARANVKSGLNEKLDMLELVRNWK